MNYKEKYKKALERAKKLYEQGTITESLGYVFPELQEDKEGAVWADEHPHWISVEDDLPKEHFKDSSSKWVLVCTPLGSVYIDSYNHKNKEWVNNRKSVTHWMPMPAPPHHIIDANKKVDRVIGTADHIKTALDVLNKKGGEE